MQKTHKTHHNWGKTGQNSCYGGDIRACRRHIKHIITGEKQDKILARVETSEHAEDT